MNPIVEFRVSKILAFIAEEVYWLSVANRCSVYENVQAELQRRLTLSVYKNNISDVDAQTTDEPNAAMQGV